MAFFWRYFILTTKNTVFMQCLAFRKRLIAYDRERRNDRLWQKTLKTMAVHKEIMWNMKGIQEDALCQGTE